MYAQLYAPVSRSQFDEIMGMLPTRGGERFVRGVGKQRWAEYEGGGGILLARWVSANQQDPKRVLGFGFICEIDAKEVI